jgi:hypothetical protein
MSYPLCSDGSVKTNHPTCSDLNPDHNIWNNNGTWWLHATVHHPDYTKERVRVSLGTKDRAEARRRRDFILRGTTAIVAALPRTHPGGHGRPARHDQTSRPGRPCHLQTPATSGIIPTHSLYPSTASIP